MAGDGDATIEHREKTPKPVVIMRVASRTEYGGRNTQEDAIFIPSSPAFPYLAICDGVGGAAFGEKASELGVQTMSKFENQTLQLPPGADDEQRVRHILDEANRAVIEFNHPDPQDPKIDRHSRSTMSIFKLNYQRATATIIGVGDSPVFVYTPDNRYPQRLWKPDDPHTPISQLLRPNDRREALIARGMDSQILPHSPANKGLTEALGIRDALKPSFASLPVRPGDVFMLSSDGLPPLLHQLSLRRVLGDVSQNRIQPHEAVGQLIEEAVANNPTDNLSIIIAKIDRLK